MSRDSSYRSQAPDRNEIDALAAPTVLEFGANWCPICQAAGPAIGAALDDFPQVDHIKVEDGKGKPLGRSFSVKLWPTLVFLREGKEVARLVRPEGSEPVRQALASLAA